MKNILRLLLATSLAFSSAIAGSPTKGAPSKEPPGLTSYIVVVKPAASSESISSLIAAERIKYFYNTALSGFSAKITPEELDALQRDPNVLYVEKDSIMKANKVVRTQGEQSKPPSWGLDRIDQANLPLDKIYRSNQTGKGVNVYVVDTGISASHVDFQGRAIPAYSAIDDGRGTSDCAGHGTHVSATIGGKTYGVAKEVNLYAVRVLGCDGSGDTSGVIAGIDWVAANHIHPAVINLSLGGGQSKALDDAVTNAVAAGVTVVVAAGNSTTDACGTSPARAAGAITVAASTKTDTRASFSNYGACVDLFAPGLDITSAWIGSNTASNTISGTSMASPHTAGVAALILEQSPEFTPAQVREALVVSAKKSLIKDSQGSLNLLLQNKISVTTPTPDPVPVPVPVAPCTDCTAFEGSLIPGQSAAFPNDSYYYAQAGIQQVWLRGAATADFDVEIMLWNGYNWIVAALANSPAPDETLVYQGKAGYYALRVKAASGSGKFNLWVRYPL